MKLMKNFLFQKKKLIKTNEVYYNTYTSLDNSFFDVFFGNWYTSINNEIIFCIFNDDINKTKIYDSNFKEFISIKGFHDSNNPILNFLNYTFQVVDDNILIQNYSIQEFPNNTLGIEFSDYQKIDIKKFNIKPLKERTLFDDKYSIYYDYKLKIVYFLFMKDQKVITLELKEEKNKIVFYTKAFDIKYNFENNTNYRFKFFDNNIYILEKNKLIEINLNNFERRELVIQNVILSFLDLDDNNILLVIENNNNEQKEEINSDLRKNYFSFLNKNKFILEEKKIYYDTNYWYKKRLIKFNDNEIYFGGNIFYYLPIEKNLIKINYFPQLNFNYFLRYGKIYEIEEKYINVEESEKFCKNLKKQLWKINLYEISDEPKFIVEKNDDKMLTCYQDYDIKKYKNNNLKKNRILTCPYCPLIPLFKFGGEHPIEIKCQIHGIKKYDFNEFIINYNEIDFATCYFCGKNDNLFFCENEGFYICQKCSNNSEYKINGQKINMKDIYKCMKHLKDIKYTYNKCEDCLNEKEKIEENDFPYFCDREIPEKLENIILSESEFDEIKNKMKIFETKVNQYFDMNIKNIRQIRRRGRGRGLGRSGTRGRVRGYDGDRENNFDENVIIHDDYFKLLFIFIDIYNSFIYTYEYLSKKHFLIYSAVYNIRTIKLLPDFNIDQKELFFKSISINRFLNGEINKKYDEEIINSLFSPDEYYYNFKEKVGNIYFENSLHDIDIYYMIRECYIENNLDDFVHNYNSQDIKFYIYKIKNLDYFFLFSQTEIQILSFTIKNDKCVIKLHQKLKFLKKLDFFIQKITEMIIINQDFFLKKMMVLKYTYYIKIDLLRYQIIIFFSKYKQLLDIVVLIKMKIIKIII